MKLENEKCSNAFVCAIKGIKEAPIETKYCFDNIKIKLDTIEKNVKSLLNGFYSIYLNSQQNNINQKSNMNYDYDLII